MGKRRPRQRRQVSTSERRPTNVLSVADPAFAAFFAPFGPGSGPKGVSVDDYCALGLSALYRAVSLISGTLASLPLRSLREGDDGMPQRVGSIFDNPDGDEGQTPYEWRETLFVHRLLHGNAFGLKVFNDGGSLVRLPLVHPASVAVEAPTPEDHREGKLPVGGKWFRLTLADGKAVRYDSRDIWHVPGVSLDGVQGLSIIDIARMSLGTSISGDKAAANLFDKGALISGLVTPEDDLEEGDVQRIRQELDRTTGGYENAGKLAIVNRRLKLQPWAMSAADAQFLQSRQFQIEEIARWTGVPPHLLMQTEKQTSWGTGVEEQNRALGRTVLNPYAVGFEQRASRLLQRPRWVEFDFAGLERPSPDKEIELLIAQVSAGLLTINEARAIRNMPPLPAQQKEGVKDEEPAN